MTAHPGQSSQQILTRAAGIRRAWQSRKKYIHTEETDRLIADAYRRLREYGNKKAISGLAKLLVWPKHVVTKRGKELGLARAKEKPWTDAEEQLLEKWSGLGLCAISKKFRAVGWNRSETAINLKMKRLRIRATPNFYTGRQLAGYFGIDDHKISVWIKAGYLTAGKKGTQRVVANGGDSWAIHRDDIRRFVLHHPDEFDLGKVEKFWFLDIFSGGKLCEEFRRDAA